MLGRSPAARALVTAAATALVLGTVAPGAVWPVVRAPVAAATTSRGVATVAAAMLGSMGGGRRDPMAAQPQQGAPVAVGRNPGG
jgi:hypothetical protein